MRIDREYEIPSFCMMRIGSKRRKVLTSPAGLQSIEAELESQTVLASERTEQKQLSIE